MEAEWVPQVTVFVRTRFEGYHRWVDAPEEVAFLRDYHRHIFHVELHKTVTQLNREIEFIQLKWEVEKYIAENYKGQRFEKSCEMIGVELLKAFSASQVEVSEDGENGAVVTLPPLFSVETNPIDFDEAKAELENYQQGLHRYMSISGATARPIPKVEAKDLISKPTKDLPALEVRNYCFVGTEAEGPNRGKRVLFIPASTSPAEITAAIFNNAKVDRVYFGAGNVPYDPGADGSSLMKVLELWHDHRVDVEITHLHFNDSALRTAFESEATIISNTESDLLQVPDMLKANFFVKIVNKEVNLVEWKHSNPTFCYRNSLSDPFYAADEKV